MKETKGTIVGEILALVSFMSRPRENNSPKRSQVLLLGILFHHILQKVRGLVEGFIELRRNNNQLKNTLMRVNNQEKNCLSQLLLFLLPKSMISI